MGVSLSHWAVDVLLSIDLECCVLADTWMNSSLDTWPWEAVELGAALTLVVDVWPVFGSLGLASISSAWLMGIGVHSESLAWEVVFRRLSNDEVNPVSVSVICACSRWRGVCKVTVNKVCALACVRNYHNDGRAWGGVGGMREALTPSPPHKNR